MEEKIDKILNELNIPFKKGVSIGELVDKRTFAEIQLRFINESYEHFEQKEVDIDLDTFIVGFTPEERDRAVAFFWRKYAEEGGPID